MPITTTKDQIQINVSTPKLLETLKRAREESTGTTTQQHQNSRFLVLSTGSLVAAALNLASLSSLQRGDVRSGMAEIFLSLISSCSAIGIAKLMNIERDSKALDYLIRESHREMISGRPPSEEVIVSTLSLQYNVGTKDTMEKISRLGIVPELRV